MTSKDDNYFQRNLNSSTGEYIKRLCAIKLNKTQDDAYKYCESNGMKLLVIDSSDVQREVFETVEQFFATKGHSLFIDGKADSNGKWYYYSYGKKTPAWTGLSFRVSPSTVNETLTVSSVKGSKGIFKIEGRAKTSAYPFICEYK